MTTTTIPASARTPEITVTTHALVCEEIKCLAASMPTDVLCKFFAEKDIPEVTFEFELNGCAHMMPNAVVVENLLNCGDSELAQATEILLQIDRVNGNINHFLAHLALGLAAQSGW